MIFQKKYLEEIFMEIEAKHLFEDFYKIFLRCVKYSGDLFCGCSEYELYFNYIFKHTIKNKKNFYFFYFGILSAIFLFLHVFFLGWIFEIEFLTKIRRIFVVFFILFEILAQAFLIKKILLIKDKIIDYLNEKIILIKLLFVIFVCLSTIIIFVLLTIYNFPPNVDYILEWNYFLILLIFYFLSFLLWKKIN